MNALVKNYSGLDDNVVDLVVAPNSHHGEQSVIGSLMMDNKCYQTVKHKLHEDLFYRPNHKIIFRFIKQLLESGKPADLITIYDELKAAKEIDRCGGLPYLNIVVDNTPTSANVSAYVDILAEKYELRKLLALAANIHDLVNSNKSAEEIKGLVSSSVKAEPLEVKKTAVDNDTAFHELKLISYIEKRHIMRQLAESASVAMDLPVSTVFMVGLGVFSSMACRKWRVARRHGGHIPIGLYVVAEQPSGVGKTWCLGAFENPFSSTKADIDKTRDKDSSLPILFATNATSEGLESSLISTNGFFSAVSSEKGLFNSLFGGSYGSKERANNNDVVLNAFDGGYVSSMRVMRKGYNGFCVGGIVSFAQEGSIDALLESSKGTGLSERFLLICEPDRLGKRNREEIKSVNRDLLEQYGAMCSVFASEIIESPVYFDELNELTISHDGWKMIYKYLGQIEPHLEKGGMFRVEGLAGAVGKADIQIIKIAANLHLLSFGMYQPEIEDKYIDSAIRIFHELLESRLALLDTKGIHGDKAEYTAILVMFKDRDLRLSERQIIESRKCVKPFKGMQNTSDAIRETLLKMVKDGILIAENDAKVARKKIYYLGQ